MPSIVHADLPFNALSPQTRFSATSGRTSQPRFSAAQVKSPSGSQKEKGFVQRQVHPPVAPWIQQSKQTLLRKLDTFFIMQIHQQPPQLAQLVLQDADETPSVPNFVRMRKPRASAFSPWSLWNPFLRREKQAARRQSPD